MRCRLFVFCVLAVLTEQPSYGQASFQGLGKKETVAAAVSTSGTVVVGYAGAVAFRWKNGRMTQLQCLPGHESCSATDVSANGSVATGASRVDSHFDAVRWPRRTARDIGDPPGGETSGTNGISSSGRVIVGPGLIGGEQKAFVWNQRCGFTTLNALPGGIRSVATGVSASETIIAGYAESAGSDPFEAARWRGDACSGFVVEGLGYLHEAPSSQAFEASGDGAVVVGRSKVSGDPRNVLFEAFVWREGEGMTGLGFLSGDVSSEGWSVSNDGQVIVGRSKDANDTFRAFIWDSGNGMRDLRDVLVTYGLDMTGWTLEWATDVTVTEFGTTIVGNGVNPGNLDEGWIARIPEPVFDCLTITDFEASCADNRLTVRVRSGLPAGTALSVENDGRVRIMIIDSSGKGIVRFRRQTGIHRVSLIECSAFSTMVDCGP